MLSYLPSPLRKKYKPVGYAETVQYFNSKPFHSQLRQDNETILRKKIRSLPKKFQFAARTTQNSFKSFKERAK